MGRRIGDHTRLLNRKPVARDRAWQSMRMLRQFSIPDLVATAEIGAENAAKYVRGLERAGYLRVGQPQRAGVKAGHAIYRLVRDSGPRAPRMQSNGQTYDPNQQQRHEGGIRWSK